MINKKVVGGDLLGTKDTKNKKIRLGAHPKYKKEYCDKMVDYFIGFVEKNLKGMPQFEFFAVNILGVTPQTLINWRNTYSEFEEAYEVCKGIQKSYVINRGLSGENNPRMTQFILSTQFKMAEYSKKKPIEENVERGLSDDDRALLIQLEERLASNDIGGRPQFAEGVTFGEIPYNDNGGTEDADGE